MGIGIFAISGFFTAAAVPTNENVINRQTPRMVRATILSVDSMLFRLLTALLEPAVGLIADGYGLPVAFTGMAIVFSVVMVTILILWGRHNRRTNSFSLA